MPLALLRQLRKQAEQKTAGKGDVAPMPTADLVQSLSGKAAAETVIDLGDAERKTFARLFRLRRKQGKGLGLLPSLPGLPLQGPGVEKPGTPGSSLLSPISHNTLQCSLYVLFISRRRWKSQRALCKRGAMRGHKGRQRMCGSRCRRHFQPLIVRTDRGKKPLLSSPGASCRPPLPLVSYHPVVMSQRSARDEKECNMAALPKIGLYRRDLLMSGLGLGLALGNGLSRAAADVSRDIVAWGDSLTQGAGASTAALSYPAVAAGLFSPPRDIAIRGNGGQGSQSIAIRQGGLPLLISVADNVIPAWEPTASPQSWPFDAGIDGFFAQWISNLTWADGALTGRKTSGSSWGGVGRAVSIASGKLVIVEFDLLAVDPGLGLQVGLLGGGSWGQVGDRGYPLSPGHYKFSFVTNKVCDTLAIAGFATGVTGDFTLDNVSLTAFDTQVAVAVTARNNNILTSGGAYTGTTSGSVAGVEGTITTDASGNWTFRRESAGPDVPVPADAQFTIAETAQLRPRIAWIWSGRNDYIAPATVKANIAAMIAFLGHSRFLVASVLNASGEGTGSSALNTITALNADLAGLYGRRFVDLRAALLVNHNGSSGDLDDIAAGITPRSLRSDNIHLNDAGYAVVAEVMQAATAARGW